MDAIALVVKITLKAIYDKRELIKSYNQIPRPLWKHLKKKIWNKMLHQKAVIAKNQIVLKTIANVI